MTTPAMQLPAECRGVMLAGNIARGGPKMLDAISPPDPSEVARIVEQALAEDRAYHDVTTRALVPPDQRGHGSFLFKQGGVVCGMDVVRATFERFSSDIDIEVLAA